MARRGLVRSARALAAAALLALSGALAVPAQAQTVTTLVSNTGETVGNEVASIGAQPFTTANAAVLDSVDIRLGSSSLAGPTRVRILEDDAGSPGAELVTLFNPSSIVNEAVNNFTAPAGTLLAANKTYYVELTRRNDLGAGGPVFTSGRRYRVTGSDAQTGATDWEIGDSRYFKSNAAVTSWSTSSSVMMIAIKGTVVDVPTVTATAVTSSPDANSSYETGEVIQVTATFSEAVTVDTTGGTPSLALTIGSNPRDAEYSAADSTATALVFAYPVTTNDNDNDGISIDANALELNGGAIHEQGDASANALLAHGALSTQSGHRVNRRPVIVSGGVSVTSSSDANSSYATDDVIQVTVTFDEAVTVDTTSGTPSLALTIGSNTRYAGYSASDSTATALVFAYPVTADDNDNDGISIAEDALELNGGAIHRQGDTTASAVLDHGALSTQSGHRVNRDAFIVSGGVSVISTPRAATETYGAGETIEIEVEFSEAVNATTDTDFVISVSGMRGAALLRGNRTDTLVFGYTVQDGDSDSNGIWIGDQDRTLVGNRGGDPQNGAITTVATGRAANLTHGGLGTQSGHKVDGSLTPPDTDTAPVFTSAAAFDAAENATAAGTVEASDNDTEDDVTGYAITGGADQALFDINGTSGALTFKSAPDFEDPQDAGADNTYVVTVQATSGTGTREMTATQTITVTVVDALEKSAKPDKPTLAAVSGSSTSLTATWTKPDLNGGPEITGYDLQYRVGTTDWEDFAHTGTAVTATITGLTADTSYQIQVRAKNGETDSDWSDPSDAVSTNAPDDDPDDSGNVSEPDGEDLPANTSTTGEVDVGGSVTGNIGSRGDTDWFKVVLEAGKTYQIDLTGEYGGGGTLTDPYLDNIRDSSGRQISNTFNDDVDFANDNLDSRIIFTPTAAGTYYLVAFGSTSLTGTYTLSVRDITPAANNAPVFDPATATREVAENSAAGTDVGAPIPAATDADTGDTLTYSMEGTDAASFDFDASTRQIATIAGVDLNHEATKNSYSVTVKASDGTASATIAVTIDVTDVTEQPAKPDKPTLAAVTGSSTSLTATWTKPDLDGGPDITGYALEYREGATGTWTSFAHSGTAITTTITGLTADTSYQARVRAGHHEAPSDWSDPSDAVKTNAAAPTPTLSIADAAASEGDDLTFTATLSAAAAAEVTATWTASIESGDTAAAADLGTTKTGTVTVAAGGTTATFEVPTAEDSTVEANETFTVTLTGPSSNAVLGTATATGTIDNDDEALADTPVVTIAAGASPVTEGTAAEFTLTRTATGTALTVAVAVTETGDVISGTATSTTVAFAAAAATATLTVATEDDADDEADSVVTATVAAGTGYAVGSPGSATVTVQDDDLPVVTIAKDKNVVNENEGDAGFTLTRVGLTAGTLAVTVGVTQQEGRDLLPDGAATSTTVTFAMGASTATLTVELENDNLFEPTGGLTVEVQAGTGYTVGSPASATVTVVDTDEGLPMPANLTASQGAGVGEAGLSWDPHASHLQFSRHEYRYKTGGGYGGWTDIPDSGQHDSLVGGDGSNLTGYTVTGLVGGQAHTFEVRTAAGSGRSANSNEAMATPRTAAVSFGAAAYSVDEGATVEVTVSLSGAPGREVTVPVSAAGGGGATAPGETGADWSGVPESVTFGATSTAQTFTVAATQDTADDDGETVVLTFGTLPPGVTKGTVSEATVTIVDDDAAPDLPALSVADVSAEEGENLTFTVRLSAASAQTVTVDWATSVETGDTATSDTDFTAASGTLTFMPGRTEETVTVSTTEDSTDEANETFTVTLSNASNASISDATATGTIEDDDLPVVTIVKDKNAVNENEGAAGFTLSRTGSTAAALTVKVEVTQQADRDLLPDGAAAERTVTFAVGSATAALSVALENDALFEATGILTVEVQPGTGYTVGSPGSVTMAVIDTDRGLPTPANLSASVGTGPGEVVLSWDPYAPNLAISWHEYRYKTDGTYGNWTEIPHSGQQIALMGGEVGSANLTGWTVTGLVGGVEHTFEVRTNAPNNRVGAASNEDSATPRSAAVSYGASSYTVDEGATVVVTVSLSGAPEREVTVPVAAAGGGGATAQGETGEDWSGVPETVTFGATSTAQTFTVAATQDMSDDDGESVVLTFGTLPPGVEAGTVTEATVTIGDDDAAPTVTVADAAASEGDSVAFVVTLSAASGKQVTVDYATSVGAGDDATSGTDFTAASGTLTIEAGEATGTIEVAALEDDGEEDDETFTLTISNPNNATLGTDTTATGTIEDGTLPRLSVDDAEGAEDEGVEFTVTLSEAVADEVTATWTASIESGDTAVAADLTATTTDMVTVAAGATTAKFTVPVNNDTTDEPDQTFTVTLSNPSPASLVQLASDPTARGTIEDEDDPPTVGIVSASGHEGRDPDTLAPTLVLSAASEKTVTVTWTASIESGDTAAAADFVDLSAATGTVDITPGRDVTALNTIVADQVFDDALDEDDETFTVTLSAAVNATVGQADSSSDATGTMTIQDDDPTPTVTVDDAAASEGDNVAFVVTLSAVSGRDVQVDYATSVGTGQTATSGTDFTAASGTLTIRAADSTATGTVEVAATEDDAEEDDETFTLTLSDPKNATLGTASTATGTINDGTLPRLSVADAEATEGSPVTFAVTLSAEAEADVTATWTASIGSGDTAVLGDLGPTRTGTVEIEAGETDATIAVATVQDDTVEVNETFTVTLAGVSANATLGTATATGTIDNDDLVTLSVADVSAAEGDTAGEGLTFTVTMTEAAPEDVTVDWTASIGSGDSASADDLTGDKTGTVTIDKGETTGMFTVPTADTTDEPRQTFTVTLSNPTPASLAQLAADPTAEGRIEDDDDPPTVDVADATATEGDNLEFAVTLSAESEKTVTVRLTTLHEAEDTAEPADLGPPFVADLTFDPGDTEETAVVGTVDDLLDEDAETFKMQAYEWINVSAGDIEATGTINDNDDPPTVTVADGTASEGDDVAFVVTLSAESGRDVEVDYATSVGTGQTATSGTDFTAASGTLTIEAGEETGTIEVAALEDDAEENDETFTLTISDPKNATLTTDTTATGTINNRSLPALSVAAAAAAEGDGVEFTVTLSAADAADVTFTWTASLATDDTAVADDFTDLPAATGTLTIAAGGETAKFTVPTAEDSADEADETFTVTLSGVSANAELGTGASAKGTIRDDDDPPAVSFGAASYAVDEGGSVEVTVVLSAPSGRPEVVVPLAHAGEGGATPQDGTAPDYGGVPASVTFAAGATERTFTIEAPADAYAETGESVALSFATLPDGAAPGSVTRSAVSLNDVAVTVSFEQASYTAAEGGSAVAVVLTLEPAVSHTLAVTMTARNGEGATAADYQGIQDGGRAIFTPGQTRSSFDVTAADDALDEADETVTLGFTFATSDTGLTKGSVPEATLRLTDDDDPPGLEDVMDASASEGDDVEFAVTLTEASGRTVNLGWEVRVDGVPASAADFDPFPQEGVLTFAPGVRTGTIAVATAEDANDEEDETFELRITGDGNVDLPGGLTVTGTIENDDGPPTLSVADAMATEGIPVSFTVTLTPPSGKQVTVNYATSVETGDNATSDTDFTAADGTLTFRPGQTTKTVRVETVRDGVEEGNETFTLTLSDATNATLPDPPTARGTIEDEIAPPPEDLEAEPVEGSYTSLVVRWEAPDTDGGPALTGYGLRHRERPGGDWVEVSHAGTVTTATLTGLEVNTVYEVEVRALYGEMQSVWVRVAGQVRTAALPPARVRNVRLVGGPGSDDGVWSTGERVVVEVRYDKPVVVEQSDCWTYNADGSCRPSGPYMLVAFSSDARPGYGGTLSTPLAPYVRGSGTNVLTFGYTVGAAEDGARGAWAAHNGMFLRGATIRTLEGGDGASRYTNTRVMQVTVRKPGGGAWTAGATVRVAVRFAGPVQYTPPDEPQNLDEVVVDETGGTPTIGLLLGDAPNPRLPRTARYERGSESDTLTFEYEVRSGDGRVSAVEVVADSLARNGATIRNEEGYDAELEHVSVLWYSPLALRVRDAAAREGGTLEFAMELARASPAPVTVDYETADGTATAGRDYTAKRGTVTFAPGRMRGTVEVPVLRDGEAEDAETVVLRLSNARAGGSRAPVEVTVAQAEGTIEDVAPEAPSGALTARFARAPAEHDGQAFTLRIAFSEAIRMSGPRLRGDVVAVSGGRATKAGAVNGRKDLWELTVKPDPRADVTVTLAGGAACDTPAAVCTADGQALSNTVSATVRGPVTVSVADARVREAAGATLDFAVSLSRAASGTVAVAYATADGSARAGSDYTARKGQLRFAPGETEKTVSVPVLDDAHDEGEETMRLRLSAASGAAIADGVATGTIENTDHMPAAWLARFGRTVTDQVLNAVEARLAASRAAGTRVRLAGQALPFRDAAGHAKTAANDNAGAGDNASGRVHRADARDRVHRADARDREAVAAIRDWMAHAGANPGSGAGAGAWRGDGDGPGGRVQSRALTGRDFVTGTSFELTGGSAEAGGHAALWGRGAISRFDGREGDLTLDGEVTTGLVGADWASAPGPGSGAGRWTAGLAVGHARGTGSYTEGGGCTGGDGDDSDGDGSNSGAGDDGAGDDGDGDGNDPGPSGCAGEVESTLTGLWPYGGLKLTDRLSISAAAGYGAGELTLTPKSETDGPFTADLTMAMGAAGLRGEVLVPPPEGGLALAVKGDTRFTRTQSKATRDAGGGRLEAATGDVWLLRLGIEGSRRFAPGGDTAGMVLTPSFEIGARLDGGDAETGLGVDLGGSLAFAAPKQGVALDLKARGLVAHEARGFREWGASASLTWDPRPSTDRGLALRLRQGWGGSPTGSMDALLGRETLAGLAADPGSGAGAGDNGGTASAGRLEAELGYGIALFGGGFTGTPNLGIGLSDTSRDYRLGWRLTSARPGDPGFEIGLDATRREALGADAEHGVMLRGAIRW